jgi:hypothetical protein
MSAGTPCGRKRLCGSWKGFQAAEFTFCTRYDLSEGQRERGHWEDQDVGG